MSNGKSPSAISSAIITSGAWYTDAELDPLIEEVVREIAPREPHNRYLLLREDKSATPQYVAITSAVSHATPKTYRCLNKHIENDAFAWVSHLEEFKSQETLTALSHISEHQQLDELVKKVPHLHRTTDEATRKHILTALRTAHFNLSALQNVIVSYKADQKDRAQNDAFDEIMPQLKKHPKGTARILIPYALGRVSTESKSPSAGSHWTTLEIIIQKTDSSSYAVTLQQHDPFGKGLLGADPFEFLRNTITRRIHETTPHATVTVERQESSYNTRQADGSSCGPITVDDIAKRARNQTLNRPNPFSASDIETLRSEHQKKFLRRIPSPSSAPRIHQSPTPSRSPSPVLESDIKTDSDASPSQRGHTPRARSLSPTLSPRHEAKTSPTSLLGPNILSLATSEDFSDSESDSDSDSDINTTSPIHRKPPSLPSTPRSTSNRRSPSPTEFTPPHISPPSRRTSSADSDTPAGSPSPHGEKKSTLKLKSKKRNSLHVHFPKDPELFAQVKIIQENEEDEEKKSYEPKQKKSGFYGNRYYQAGLLTTPLLANDKHPETAAVIKKLNALQKQIEQVPFQQEKRWKDAVDAIKDKLTTHDETTEAAAELHKIARGETTLPRERALHMTAGNSQKNPAYLETAYLQIEADVKEGKRNPSHAVFFASLERAKHLQSMHLYNQKRHQIQKTLNVLANELSSPDFKSTQKTQTDLWNFINNKKPPADKKTWFKQRLESLSNTINEGMNTTANRLDNLNTELEETFQDLLFALGIKDDAPPAEEKTTHPKNLIEKMFAAYNKWEEKWNANQEIKQRAEMEIEFKKIEDTLRHNQKVQFLQSAIHAFQKSQNDTAMRFRQDRNAKRLLVCINLIKESNHGTIPRELLPSGVNIGTLEDAAKNYLHNKMLGETTDERQDRQNEITQEWETIQKLPWFNQRSAIQEFYKKYTNTFDLATLAEEKTTANPDVTKQTRIAAENLNLAIELIVAADKERETKYHAAIIKHQENPKEHELQANKLVKNEIAAYLHLKKTESNFSSKRIEQAKRLDNFVMLYEHYYKPLDLDILPADVRKELAKLPQTNRKIDQTVAIEWARHQISSAQHELTEMITFWKNANQSFFNQRREQLVISYLESVYQAFQKASHPTEKTKLVGIILYRLDHLVSLGPLPSNLLIIQQELITKYPALKKDPFFQLSRETLSTEDDYFHELTAGINQLDLFEGEDKNEWLLFGDLDDLEQSADMLSNYIEGLELLKTPPHDKAINQATIDEQLEEAKLAQQRIITAMLALIKGTHNKPSFIRTYRANLESLYILGVPPDFLRKFLLDQTLTESNWKELALLTKKKIADIFTSLEGIPNNSARQKEIKQSLIEPFAELLTKITGRTISERNSLIADIMDSDKRATAQAACLTPFLAMIDDMRQRQEDKKHVVYKRMSRVNPLKDRLLRLSYESPLRADPATRTRTSLYSPSMNERRQLTAIPEHDLSEVALKVGSSSDSTSSSTQLKKRHDKFIEYVTTHGTTEQKDEAKDAAAQGIGIFQPLSNKNGYLILPRNIAKPAEINPEVYEKLQKILHLKTATRENFSAALLTDFAKMITTNPDLPVKNALHRYPHLHPSSNNLQRILQSYKNLHKTINTRTFRAKKYVNLGDARTTDKLFDDIIQALNQEIAAVKKTEAQIADFLITQCKEMFEVDENNTYTFALSFDELNNIRDYITQLNNKTLLDKFKAETNVNDHFGITQLNKKTLLEKFNAATNVNDHFRNQLQKIVAEKPISTSKVNRLKRFCSKYVTDPQSIDYFCALVTDFNSAQFNVDSNLLLQHPELDLSNTFKQEFLLWMNDPTISLSYSNPYFKFVRNALLISEGEDPRPFLRGTIKEIASPQSIKNSASLEFFQYVLTENEYNAVKSSIAEHAKQITYLFQTILNPEDSPFISGKSWDFISPDNKKQNVKDYATADNYLNWLIHLSPETNTNLSELLDDLEKFVNATIAVKKDEEQELERIYTGALTQPLEHSAHIMFFKIINANLMIAQKDSNTQLQKQAEFLKQAVEVRCLHHFIGEIDLLLPADYGRKHKIEENFDRLQSDIPDFKKYLSALLANRLSNALNELNKKDEETFPSTPADDNEFTKYYDLIVKCGTNKVKADALKEYLKKYANQLSAEDIIQRINKVDCEESQQVVSAWLDTQLAKVASQPSKTPKDQELKTQDLVKLYRITLEQGTIEQQISSLVELTIQLILTNAELNDIQDYIDDLVMVLPDDCLENFPNALKTAAEEAAITKNSHSIYEQLIGVYGNEKDQTDYFKKKLTNLLKQTVTSNDSLNQIVEIIEKARRQNSSNDNKLLIDEWFVHEVYHADISAKPYFPALFHLTQKYAATEIKAHTQAIFIDYLLSTNATIETAMANIHQVRQLDFSIVSANDKTSLIKHLNQSIADKMLDGVSLHWSPKAQLLANALAPSNEETLPNISQAISAQQEKWLQDILHSPQACEEYEDNSATSELHRNNILWLEQISQLPEAERHALLSQETQDALNYYVEHRGFIDDQYPEEINNILLTLASSHPKIPAVKQYIVDDDEIISQFLTLENGIDNISELKRLLKPILSHYKVEKLSNELTLTIIQAKLEETVRRCIRMNKPKEIFERIREITNLMPKNLGSVPGNSNPGKKNILFLIDNHARLNSNISSSTENILGNFLTIDPIKNIPQLKSVAPEDLPLLILGLDNSNKAQMRTAITKIIAKNSSDSINSPAEEHPIGATTKIIAKNEINTDPIAAYLSIFSQLLVDIPPGFGVAEVIKNQDELIAKLAIRQPSYELAQLLNNAPPLDSTRMKKLVIAIEEKAPYDLFISFQAYWQKRINDLLATNQVSHSDLGILIFTVGSTPNHAGFEKTAEASKLIQSIFHQLKKDPFDHSDEMAKQLEDLCKIYPSCDKANKNEVHKNLDNLFTPLLENIKKTIRISEESANLTDASGNHTQYSRLLEGLGQLCNVARYTNPELTKLLKDAKLFLEKYYHPNSKFFMVNKKDHASKASRQRQSNLVNAYFKLVKELGTQEDKTWCDRLRENMLAAYHARGATFAKRHAPGQSVSKDGKAFRYNTVEAEKIDLANFLSRYRQDDKITSANGDKAKLTPRNSFTEYCKQHIGNLSLSKITRAMYENKLAETKDKLKAKAIALKEQLKKLASLQPTIKENVMIGLTPKTIRNINLSALPDGWQKKLLPFLDTFDPTDSDSTKELLIFLRKGIAQAAKNKQAIGQQAMQDLVDVLEGINELQLALSTSFGNTYQDSCAAEIDSLRTKLSPELRNEFKPIYTQAIQVDCIKTELPEEKLASPTASESHIKLRVKQEKEAYILIILNEALTLLNNALDVETSDRESDAAITKATLALKNVEHQIDCLLVANGELSSNFISGFSTIITTAFKNAGVISDHIESKSDKQSPTKRRLSQDTSRKIKLIKEIRESKILNLIADLQPENPSKQLKAIIDASDMTLKEQQEIEVFKMRFHAFHRATLNNKTICFSTLNGTEIQLVIDTLKQPGFKLMFTHHKDENFHPDFFTSLQNMMIQFRDNNYKSDITPQKLEAVLVYWEARYGKENALKEIDSYVKHALTRIPSSNDMILINTWGKLDDKVVLNQNKFKNAKVLLRRNAFLVYDDFETHCLKVVASLSSYTKFKGIHLPIKKPGDFKNFNVERDESRLLEEARLTRKDPSTVDKLRDVIHIITTIQTTLELMRSKISKTNQNWSDAVSQSQEWVSQLQKIMQTGIDHPSSSKSEFRSILMKERDAIQTAFQTDASAEAKDLTPQTRAQEKDKELTSQAAWIFIENCLRVDFISQPTTQVSQALYGTDTPKFPRNHWDDFQLAVLCILNKVAPNPSARKKLSALYASFKGGVAANKNAEDTYGPELIEQIGRFLDESLAPPSDIATPSKKTSQEQFGVLRYM